MDNVRVVRWLKGLGEENNFPSVVILELERDLNFSSDDAHTSYA